ncbi:unnamed protein product [Prunus armeniaca]
MRLVPFEPTRARCHDPPGFLVGKPETSRRYRLVFSGCSRRRPAFPASSSVESGAKSKSCKNCICRMCN